MKHTCGCTVRFSALEGEDIVFCPLHANAAATAAEIKRLQEECERLQSQDPNPLHARIYKLETQLGQLRASHAQLLAMCETMDRLLTAYVGEPGSGSFHHEIREAIAAASQE